MDKSNATVPVGHSSVARRNHSSLDRVSNGVQYVQMLIARVSALFLMLSLITATWNLLIKDALFAALPWLEWVWGLAQAVAVDSALAVVFVRMAECIQNKQWGRSVVYGIVGLLLLFVAWAIVDVESLRQALDITLASAAGRLPLQPFISVDFITQVRSVVVVLLIAVSGFEFVYRPEAKESTVVQDTPRALPVPNVPVGSTTSGKSDKTNAPRNRSVSNGHPTDATSKLAEFHVLRPDATISETIAATGLSQSTISRWRKSHGSEQLTRFAVEVGEREN